MDDQISRNTLLRYVADWQYSEAIVGNEAVYDTIEKFYHMVEEMPSAQPEQIARDIATIIENEKDMRVILKNAEHTETHSCDCERTGTHESSREWYMKGYRDGQPRWIPCSERNPDKDGRYLITGKMGTVYSLDLEDGRWYGGIKPIAWCVLPEPYKESEL